MISKARLKQIKSLHLKKNRSEERLFLAEGVKAVNELISQCPALIKEVYGTEDFIEESKLRLKEKQLNYEIVNEDELRQMSSLSAPNRAIAVCHFFEDATFEREEICLYLDDIRDPGNFGTMIRLADWFGMKNVYCSRESCEIYNSKVIQASMGAFIRVKVHYCDLNKLTHAFPEKKVYGAVLNGKDIYTLKAEPGVIVIGNEANGIREENLKLITDRITIPSGSQSGGESLNAAMAASIIVSEFHRQLRVVKH